MCINYTTFEYITRNNRLTSLFADFHVPTGIKVHTKRRIEIDLGWASGRITPSLSHTKHLMGPLGPPPMPPPRIKALLRFIEGLSTTIIPSKAKQLRLVVYPIIYRVLAPSKRWLGMGFLNHQQYLLDITSVGPFPSKSQVNVGFLKNPMKHVGKKPGGDDCIAGGEPKISWILSEFYRYFWRHRSLSIKIGEKNQPTNASCRIVTSNTFHPSIPSVHSSSFLPQKFPPQNWGPNNPGSLLAVSLPGFVAFRCFKTGENAGGFFFPKKVDLKDIPYLDLPSV